jgi:hypothetical protein
MEDVMVIIAVLLIAAILALTIGAFLAATEGAVFEVLEDSFSVDGGAVFAAGIATGLALVGAAWMLRVGARRSTMRRRELNALRAAHQRQEAALAKDREVQEAEDVGQQTLVRPYIGPGERREERAEPPGPELPRREGEARPMPGLPVRPPVFPTEGRRPTGPGSTIEPSR